MADTVVIIGGGSKGIGKAICEAFSKKGAKVVVADIDEENGKEAAKAANGMFVRTDISNEGDVKKLIEETEKAYGRIDVVVNTASIFIYKGVEKLSAEEWDRVMKVNVGGLFLLAKHSVPLLKKSNGVIIDVSSGLGEKLESESPSYIATKDASVALIKNIAKMYAPDVRAIAVCPGPVDTPLLSGAFSGDLKKYGNLNPMKRVCKPEEVADLVVNLASAGYVTGSVHKIDGGE